MDKLYHQAFASVGIDVISVLEFINSFENTSNGFLTLSSK